MKKFDVEIKRSVSGNDPLPVGGYVAKIMNAEVKEYDWGEVLVVSFDIAEGEYKDFFANQYKANTNEDKKWKGNFRINVPQEGNQWFDSQKRSFGNAIACIEESNNGYHWDWDEAKLKGKMVGVLFRNFEWEVNGNTGWSTECGTFVSVDDIRNGNYRQMKDRPLKNKPVEVKPVATDFEEILDDDLPFN
jgi:hypothetical protein